MKKCAGLLLLGILLLGGCQMASQRVSVDGSTSMERVIGTLGEAFVQENSNVTFTYNPTGSGAGIQAVLSGRCDIGLSSRYLTDKERAQGLEETVLAYDGIAVVVHPDNPVGNLTLAQLRDIYTGAITNWETLGAAAGEIVVVGREAGSGTREGFESILGLEAGCAYRQELTSSGDVITTVASNPLAIGYTSLASVKDTVQTLSLDGVLPSQETVQAGTYGLFRPFLLVTREGAALGDSAQAFLCFALSQEAEPWIVQAGAIPEVRE